VILPFIIIILATYALPKPHLLISMIQNIYHIYLSNMFINIYKFLINILILKHNYCDNFDK
jgi:hypothetical protein